MALKKPPTVESDPFKSAKWDELTSGRAFSQSDAPTLALLCQWHKIAEQTMARLSALREAGCGRIEANDFIKLLL